jgi:hypothetical protein
MQDRYPLTIAQLRQAKEDLAAMKDRAEEISKLMVAGYGISDARAIRAGELNAAIQRLQWELDRSDRDSSEAATA